MQEILYPVKKKLLSGNKKKTINNINKKNYLCNKVLIN